uniref:Uncharacterized protein n=1 Tax=Romanomermis culicivorax TaxID=13658 RepID=A0A915JRD2_ROMCU
MFHSSSEIFTPNVFSLQNKEYEKCKECMDLDQMLTEAGQTYEKNQAEINKMKVAIERLSTSNLRVKFLKFRLDANSSLSNQVHAVDHFLRSGKLRRQIFRPCRRRGN